MGDIPAARLMGRFWGPSIDTVGTRPLEGVGLVASMRSINSRRMSVKSFHSKRTLRD
jgi:hypothetical protein